VTDIEMWSIRVSGWNAEVARAVSPFADVVAVPDGTFDGAALLVSVATASETAPAPEPLEKIRATLVAAGASVRSSALVGSHAARYTVPQAAVSTAL